MLSSLKTSVYTNFNACFVSKGYKTFHPFINKKLTSQELTEELVKSAVDNQNGFIVLNKPHGISFAEDTKNDNSTFEVSLKSLKPILQNKFNCKELLNVKVPEKYASGVAIFCTDDSLLRRAKKCFRSMTACGHPFQQYECIVIGQPTRKYGFFEGGITIESSPNGKQKGIRLIKDCPKSMVRGGIVKQLKIQHSTLVANELASRIIITTTRTKWHSVRVYAATNLVSPILGDRVFGRFVRTVMGTPVTVDTFSPAASQPQKIPEDILSKIGLQSRKDIEIPLHMHLSKVILQNFPSKGKLLQFTVEPPEYYKWTCSVLGLLEENRQLTAKEEDNFIYAT